MSQTTSVPMLALPEQFNAATAFLDRNIVEGRATKTAIYCEDKAYTYGEIADTANRVGNGLLELGVEIEQRIALLLLDSSEFAATFFGSIKIGAIPVPLNTMLRPADYEYLLNDSRARVLIIHAALWQHIQNIMPHLDYLHHVIIVGLRQSGAAETATQHDFEGWISKASSHLMAAATSKDDSAFWLYSSGSTGFPKGCVHLQHDMTYCVETFGKSVLSIREDDIMFSASKLFFAFGLGNNLYYPFAIGASALYHPGRVLAEDIFKLINRYHPTLFFGAPTLYTSMLTIHEAEKRFDTSSLRLCVALSRSFTFPYLMALVARRCYRRLSAIVSEKSVQGVRAAWFQATMLALSMSRARRLRLARLEVCLCVVIAQQSATGINMKRAKMYFRGSGLRQETSTTRMLKAISGIVVAVTICSR